MNEDPKEQAKRRLYNSYAGKLCPILTKTAAAPASGLGGQGLVGATGAPVGGGSEEEVMGCQGPNCMLFMLTSADPQGNAVGGACAVAVIPGALVQLRDTIVAIATQPQPATPKS